MSSYAPSYSYVTNKNRSVTFNSTALGYYDFVADTTRARALLWHEKTVFQTIVYGDSIKSLGATNSKKVGTMRALPEWIMDGAVVSLQGGHAAVTDTATQLIEAQVPIAAFWMQDWVGLASFAEGQRLEWNWRLNRGYYPHWDELTKGWAQKGIRPMIYINPYFSNVSQDGNDTSQF
jgi:alpha-glucosidase